MGLPARRFLEGWVEEVMTREEYGCNAYDEKRAIINSCYAWKRDGYLIPEWVTDQVQEWSVDAALNSE